ncbi:MAG: GGDEF domain-containing protein, partial [Actinomycetota bacterium]
AEPAALIAAPCLVALMFLFAGRWRVAVDRAVALRRERAARERLAVESRTDPLTRVLNRRGWEEELALVAARARRGSHPFCVALIDLDHFKAFNDRHGHQAGDRLLTRSAAAWAAEVRAVDVIARYGGEEFAVAFPGCDLEAAGEIAERLRRACPPGVTCSIGIAEWDGTEEPESLVRRADTALYSAKGGGRDRVVVAASPAEAPAAG